MKVIKSRKSTEETVAALMAGIEKTNMRLVNHINGQANAKLIGKEVPADQILEIFRPDFALRVWQACKPAGIDIPLRIHIYENGNDEVLVAFREPDEVFAPYDCAELAPVAEDLGAIFNSILAEVA
jgi:uncharacterized protein (DUF302 family)